MIIYLEWDSEFFEKKIGKLEHNIYDSLNLLNNDISEYDLIYIFSDDKVDFLKEPIDIKVTYSKKTQKKIENVNVIVFDKTVHEYEDLLALAYISGHDSRFLKDNFFGELAFKKLYKRWIDNSLNDSNTIVFVYVEDNKLLGFVTCTEYEKHATIGLIAVSNNAQGKGIGGKLIDAVENHLCKDTMLYVATQKTNKQACDFYERKDFEINSIKYIYHYVPLSG